MIKIEPYRLRKQHRLIHLRYAIRITQNILHFCPIGFTHFSDLPKVLLPKYTERYTESR